MKEEADTDQAKVVPNDMLTVSGGQKGQDTSA